jgi:hypothetical protein
MRTFYIALVLPLILSASSEANAVCGDVTGDGAVTSVDALKVLTEAVGLDAGLTCDGGTSPPFLAYIAMDNVVSCSRGGTYTGTWSGGNKTWNLTPTGIPPTTQDWLPVHNKLVAGTFSIKYGNCGTVDFTFTDWGVAYPLPRDGAVRFWSLFDGEFVWLLADVAPFDVSGGQTLGDSASTVEPLYRTSFKPVHVGPQFGLVAQD